MSSTGAFTAGMRRVLRAPWLIVGLWSSTFVLALAPAALLHARIAEHLGSSMAAETAAAGLSFDWWNEFLAEASGISHTFVPSIIGFAAVLRNLSAIADGESPAFVIALAATAYGALSLFLLGGILDRLARDRALGSGAFFAACGVFFFRFLRLALLAAPIYLILFMGLHPWLFETLYPAWTRNLLVERTAFLVRVILYAMFGALVLLTNLILDYAKIRAVVEDRHSMLGAFPAGVRFVRRNPGATAALYALNAGLFVILAVLYAMVATGTGPVLVSFAVGQLYILLRVIVRLQFAASAIALFQGRLAHAGYAATPAPAWPDSPAAEIVRPDPLRLEGSRIEGAKGLPAWKPARPAAPRP